MTSTRGQCLCGAVTFAATSVSRDVGACHCGMCRRWAAGPFFGVTVQGIDFDSDAELGVYASSPWAERGHCKACGSPLFWRLRDQSMTIVSVNALSYSGDMTLDHEVYIDEKPGYYNFAEKTRQLTGADIMNMIKSKE